MTGIMIRSKPSNDFHSPRFFENTSPILNLQVGQARQWGLLVSLNTNMFLNKEKKKRLNLMSLKCNKLNVHKILNTNENHNS